MADKVDVLAVMDSARVCVAAYPTHDPMVSAGPVWDRAAALAKHDKARAAVAQLVAANAARECCTWSQQDDGYDCYSTGCGFEFLVTEGPPTWPFCCYCTKPIKAVAWSEDADEEAGDAR